ncbi:hypothetical protein EON81_16730 [bacterium]|nr:MAG: hypothetical protein EON81_16730 [bacterium]
MRLKLDVLTEFGATWYPSASDTETLFDRAHREIVSELPVRWDVTDVLLVPGNDTYALPDRVFRVDEAYYVPCADPSTWRRIEPFDFTFEPTVGYDWNRATHAGVPTQSWRVVPNASSNGGGLSLQISPTPPDPIVLPACPLCGDSPCCCDVGEEPEETDLSDDPGGLDPGDLEDPEELPGGGEELPESDFPEGPGSIGGGSGDEIGPGEDPDPISVFSTGPAPPIAYNGPGADPNPDPLPAPVTPDPLLAPRVYYPFIRLIGASWVPLSMGDELPRGILSEDLYLTHMAYAWAKIQDPERSAYWRELHRLAKADNMRHLKSRMPKTPAHRLVPITSRRQTRRV